MITPEPHKLSEKLEKFLASYTKDDMFRSIKQDDFLDLFSDYFVENNKPYEDNNLGKEDAMEILGALWDENVLTDVDNAKDKHEFLRLCEAYIANSKVYLSVNDIEEAYDVTLHSPDGKVFDSYEVEEKLEDEYDSILKVLSWEMIDKKKHTKQERYLVIKDF